MKRFTCLKPKFIGLLLLIFIFNIGSAIAQGFSQQTQNKLQQVLQSFQDDPSFVGGMSAAIKVDGLAFWQGASGYAARNVDAQNNLLPGGVPFTTGTISQIYSVTKTFTASLVLELAKEGVFNLDDPISKYLSMNLINPGLNGSVTIRQLLAHESGYSNYTDEMQFLLAVAFDPTRIWSAFDVLYFVHQINTPGSVRRYSSTNYIALGAIIEAATGKPVQQYYHQRFFTPLGLNSMYLGVREPQPAGTLLASPHENLSAFSPIFQLTGQPTFPNAYTNVSRLSFNGIVSAAFTGGGIVSNVRDVAEWGNALFNGRAISKTTLDEMLKSISPTPDAQGDYLGYGIWKSSRMSTTETFIGHDGNAPGYRSVMYYQPEKKLTIAILTNFNGADIYAIAKALYAALPEFTAGNENRKEPKIILCYNGHQQIVDRNGADALTKKGAYLGDCESSDARRTNPKEVTSNPIKNSLEVFPNPSSGQVQFSFSANENGPVTLDLYDANGKLVNNIFRGNLQKGVVQEIIFARGKLPAGIYISTLKTNSGIRQQKVVLTR